jgi:hypothetical protein
VEIFAAHPELVENRLIESTDVILKNHPTTSIAPFFTPTTNRTKSLDQNPLLDEGIKPKQITIANLQGLTMTKKRQTYTALLNNWWTTRLMSAGEPFILIVEEPRILEESILTTLAVEGKKNGVTMCLLCQHPSEMNRRVLSQMGTQIMGRTIDVQDLQSLTHMALDKSILLPQLKTGEWIINGLHLHQPTKIHIRNRYTINS